MTPLRRNIALACLNTAVWGLNTLSITGTIALKSRSGIPVILETQPTRTKVSIDGNILASPDTYNGWIQSPADIRLSPGQHKLLVERPGYAPHSFKVLVSASDTKLELSSELEVLPQANNSIEIRGDDGDFENVTVILDQGLEMGALPLTLEDLAPGTHVVEITTKGFESFRTKPHICTFSIPPGGVPFTEITVSRRGNKFSAQGCRKLKKLP